MKATRASPAHQPGAQWGRSPPLVRGCGGAARSSKLPARLLLPNPPAPALHAGGVWGCRPPPRGGWGSAGPPEGGGRGRRRTLTFPLLLTTEAQQHPSPPRRPGSGETRPSARSCPSTRLPAPGTARRFLRGQRPLRRGGPGPLGERGSAAGVPTAFLRLRFPLGVGAGAGGWRRGGGGRLRLLLAAAAGGRAPPAAEVTRGPPEHSARRTAAELPASPSRMRDDPKAPPPTPRKPRPTAHTRLASPRLVPPRGGRGTGKRCPMRARGRAPRLTAEEPEGGRERVLWGSEVPRGGAGRAACGVGRGERGKRPGGRRWKAFCWWLIDHQLMRKNETGLKGREPVCGRGCHGGCVPCCLLGHQKLTRFCCCTYNL